MAADTNPGSRGATALRAAVIGFGDPEEGDAA